MNRGGTIKCSDGRIIIPRDIFLHLREYSEEI